MEQTTDAAETATIDRLILLWSENISVSFCLRAPSVRDQLFAILLTIIGLYLYLYLFCVFSFHAA